MANPLKILTQLSASEAAEFNKAVTFKENVAMSGKKITGLDAGAANGEAVRYEQLTSAETRISAEESLSRSAEGSLSTRVSAEESLARSAEGSLSTRLGAEESLARSAEGSLTLSVSAEASLARSAEGSLSSRVLAEENLARSAEGSLTSRVSLEESVSRAAEGSLTTRVSAEESLARSAEGSLATRVSAEESLARSAEGSLTARVSAEESAARAAEGSLTTRVAAEETLARSAEGSLSTRVLNEESTARAAEGSLSTRVSAEESLARSAEFSLTSRVSAEESLARSAEGSLTTRISSETSARVADSQSLTTRLIAEESARLSADASIAAAFLRIDGSVPMSGNLDMAHYNISSIHTASVSYLSATDAVVGNLTVNGGLTYLNTTNLDVTDKQITIGKGATGAALDNAGIYLGSDTSPDAKIMIDTDVNGGEWLVSGSGGLAVAATGSSQAGFTISNGKFNIEAAFRKAFSDIAAVDGYNYALGQNYARYRKVETKTTDAAGRAVFELSGSSYTAFKSVGAGGRRDGLAALAVDVMVQQPDGSFTNDLVSVKVEAFNTHWVKVTVDAPAHAEQVVRLIAVVESVDENNIFDAVSNQ